MKNTVGQLGLLGDRFNGPVTGDQLNMFDVPVIPPEEKKTSTQEAPAPVKPPVKEVVVPVWIIRGRCGQA